MKEALDCRRDPLVGRPGRTDATLLLRFVEAIPVIDEFVLREFASAPNCKGARRRCGIVSGRLRAAGHDRDPRYSAAADCSAPTLISFSANSVSFASVSFSSSSVC